MDLNTLTNISAEVFQCFNKELAARDSDWSMALDDPGHFKNKVLLCARLFDRVCILNNNSGNSHNPTEFMAALGCSEELTITQEKGAFESIRTFFDREKGKWIFGFLSYDLKNDVEELTSEKTDVIGFPAAHFFIPEILIYVINSRVYIHSAKKNPQEIFNLIEKQEIPEISPASLGEQNFNVRPDKEGYVKAVEELIGEIRLGNIYEINYCRELLTQKKIDPYSTAIQLSKNSPAPFSVFYKWDKKYLICASPERFLMKSGRKLISQPMKGTIKRSDDPKHDELLKKELSQSEKERSENVMIVDLVRNDLSHTAERGTVAVAELFGIYSFRFVHQMISTITSELKDGMHFAEAIRFCFPMGSMTGAPKLNAMKLIEKHEFFKRALFSGSVGLISPDSNFDFNVVIRCILYNEETGHVSIRTGSAITALCDPEKEWEECRLKARALIESIV